MRERLADIMTRLDDLESALRRADALRSRPRGRGAGASVYDRLGALDRLGPTAAAHSGAGPAGQVPEVRVKDTQQIVEWLKRIYQKPAVSRAG